MTQTKRAHGANGGAFSWGRAATGATPGQAGALRRPARLRTLGVLVPTLGAVLVAAGVGVAAGGNLVGDVNGSRAGSGLAGYSVCNDLSGVAQAWASHEAATATLAHNPYYASQITGWTSAGENVGTGPDVDTIHAAMMNSAPHRANILSPVFTEIGVGVAVAGNGAVYVDEVFRHPSGAGCNAPAPPPPPPVPAPRPPVPVPVPVRTIPVTVPGHLSAPVPVLASGSSGASHAAAVASSPAATQAAPPAPAPAPVAAGPSAALAAVTGQLQAAAAVQRSGDVVASEVSFATVMAALGG